MDFGLSEEQQQLKESARAFLSGECPTTFVRKTMATDDGYPRELYDHIAKLGWTGLIVPEKFGGAGLGMLDMAMVLEEGGYAAMPGPFLFSSVIAASALKLGGSDQLNAKWLTALPEGPLGSIHSLPCGHPVTGIRRHQHRSPRAHELVHKLGVLGRVQKWVAQSP